MDNEVERLQGLLEACHRVLPRLESGQSRMDDDLARAIEEKCREVERRLDELGVSFASCFAEAAS
jgi:hypothetical protein